MSALARRSAASVAAVAGLVLAGCGGDTGGGSAMVSTITATPGTTTSASLQVTLSSQPERSFVVNGGHWRVCDHGQVTNTGAAVARDVRVTVVYVDHGATVGQLTPQDAPQDGGALGDIAGGQTKPFTVCGLADQEPDQDRVEAMVAR